jgi:hypothetical protein
MGYSRAMAHEAQDPSAARIAENNRRFREANEGIEAAARELDADFRVPFICECADERCTQVVRLSFDEYAHVRAQTLWFLVAPSHEHAEGAMARPVERHEEYVIVEKTGQAAEILRGPEERSASGT